jgi:hypothetical protein
MKKAALFFLMAWGFFARGQEIIYTISASIDGESTHLDSILFENLDNQTHFLVSDLPLLPAYDIDLSLQLLVTGIAQIDLPGENTFRLTKNMPGEVDIQFTGHVTQRVRLTVHNLSGQMVYASTLPALHPGAVQAQHARIRHVCGGPRNRAWQGSLQSAGVLFRGAQQLQPDGNAFAFRRACSGCPW